jgi:hypothetical protein
MAMREEENLVRKEVNRPTETCRVVQQMGEISVTTDATRQSELEANKENMEEETPTETEIEVRAEEDSATKSKEVNKADVDVGKSKGLQWKVSEKSQFIYVRERQTVRTEDVFLHYVGIASNHRMCVEAPVERGEKELRQQRKTVVTTMI